MKPNSTKGILKAAMQWGISLVAALILMAVCYKVYTANAGQVYTATAGGFGGDITVSVTVKSGELTDVKITGDNETPGLGGRAVEEMPAQLLAAKTAEVDGVSGATISSTAIRTAFIDAMGQAGIELTMPEAKAPEAEAAPAGEAGDRIPLSETGAADGTYSATEKGFGGDIVVDVTLQGSQITDVKIVGDSETAGLGAVAVEKMPAQFLEAQAADVDGMSGATVSSNAIRKAFTAALAQAGVDAASLQNMAAAGPVEKVEETLNVDVVIVGAGGAGMAAAITAKQAGMNVIILEKMPYVGGNTTKASGGMNAAGTKMQAAAIEAAADEKTKTSLEGSTVENFITDTMAGGHDINDIDLVTNMAEQSSDAIDWLESIGAPLPKIAATGGTVHMYLHEPEDGSAVGEYLVKVFSEQLDAMGIPVYLETEATGLIAADGTVTGVLAESKTTSYTINAGAVVLATGGFGANEDMYTKYRADLKGTVTTNAPGATGDGIIMAQAVGAALVDIDQIQLHPTVYQENGFLVSERLRSNGAILVNLNGERFTNDLATRDAVSAAELKQPECCAFIVYDSQYAEEKLYKKYVANGLTVQGDTLEELAANMGLDEAAAARFIETVETWNKVCNEEMEDPFGRNNGLVSLTTAPYYAIKIAPGIHHTMGGIKINTETQVIDRAGHVINGLFAAGEVTGGVHGGNRIGGNAVADIVVYGRIAGANASAYATGAAEEAPAAAGLKDGTYSASAKGMMCDVTVEITVAGGVVTDVAITGPDETPGIGTKAIEEMPAQLIAAQSAEVDGVSGATVTSTAIHTAFADAMSQAAAGSEAEEAPAGLKDGTYSASAKGMMCDVTVEITVAGGVVTDVAITGPDETPGIGTKAIEEMPAQLIAAQSAEVDGVSGATVTSTAIRTAFAEALALAG